MWTPAVKEKSEGSVERGGTEDRELRGRAAPPVALHGAQASGGVAAEPEVLQKQESIGIR